MRLFMISIFLFCTAALACASPFETPNSVVFLQDSPTSTDGNCGSNSDTNSTCLTSTFGNCCSPKGFCGSTTAYCGPGCQSDFGTCSDSSTQTISTSGSCGATSTSNLTCLGSTFGDCCSHLGYCGGNSSYCGNGCNDKFGSCGADAQTIIDSSPTSSSSSSSPLLSGAPPPTAPSISSSPANSTTPIVTSAQQQSLSTAAKAGITISAALAFLLAFILLFYILHTRRRPQTIKLPASEIDSDPFSRWEKQPEISFPRPVTVVPGVVYEMAAGEEMEPAELNSSLERDRDSWTQRKMEAKIKQERRKAMVDDRVRAGYEGAFRGN